MLDMNKDKFLKYKNYIGSIEFDLTGNCLYGKILFIDDLVTYEGETLKELECAFHEMVDDYLLTCQELGKKPQKSYSGSFNVRPGMEIHQVLAETAQYNDVSLNKLITYIFTQFIQCNLNGNKKLNILSKI